MRNFALSLLLWFVCGSVSVALLVVAAHHHGVPRWLAGAVGLAGLGVSGFGFVSIGLILVGWGVASATVRTRPSAANWIGWTLGALAAGGALGALTYGVGLPALATGPALAAVVIGALRASPFDRAHLNRRVRWFVLLVAATTLLVGLTIFL
jgi:hypothetical protein